MSLHIFRLILTDLIKTYKLIYLTILCSNNLLNNTHNFVLYMTLDVVLLLLDVYQRPLIIEYPHFMSHK
jgi:hypothetical protein